MLHGIFIYDKMDCIDMYTKYQMIYIYQLICILIDMRIN
mgnify:CR=1 FL=1